MSSYTGCNLYTECGYCGALSTYIHSHYRRRPEGNEAPIDIWEMDAPIACFLYRGNGEQNTDSFMCIIYIIPLTYKIISITGDERGDGQQIPYTYHYYYHFLITRSCVQYKIMLLICE